MTLVEYILPIYRLFILPLPGLIGAALLSVIGLDISHHRFGCHHIFRGRYL